jgi:hypothetical protein
MRDLCRRPFRFVSGGPVLTWERRIPGDSRVEQITCSAEWFYRQMVKRDG